MKVRSTYPRKLYGQKLLAIVYVRSHVLRSDKKVFKQLTLNGHGASLIWRQLEAQVSLEPNKFVPEE